MMKESDARNKWCPFVRAPLILEGGIFAVGVNRGPEGADDDRLHCRASSCMAWRWYSTDEHGEKRLGYCGLAGKPY
jgi:hypothetical protein